MQSDVRAHTCFVRRSLKCSQAANKVVTYFPVNFVRFPFSLSQFLSADSNYCLSFLPTSRQVRRMISVVLFYFCLLFVFFCTPFLGFHVPFHLRHSGAVSLYIVSALCNSGSFTFRFCIETVHMELDRRFKCKKTSKI